MNKDRYYLGIDINDEYAMVSSFGSNEAEPVTVSSQVSRNEFRIPLVLAKRKGIGQWYYGDEAIKLAKTADMVLVDHLLMRAKRDESIILDDTTYSARGLMTLFIKKLIELSNKLFNQKIYERLVITMDRLDKDNMDMFWSIANSLQLNKNQFSVIDHKESFYYFAVSQPEELWKHDVYLFEYNGDNMSYMALNRNTRTVPMLVTIKESQRERISANRDNDFLMILKKAFENKIISSVFLLGDGFESDWMKDSLNYLCRGRRVFAGNNLYTKGACYAAKAMDDEKWPFVYIGENEMKFNLSLKVKNRGKDAFYTLISAGVNWFEAEGECEVIIKGDYEIDFWKQPAISREAVIETLELTDLPKRDDGCTRVRIKAKPVSVDSIMIEIKDLGFGEFFRSTDKTWKYTMSM